MKRGRKKRKEEKGKKKEEKGERTEEEGTGVGEEEVWRRSSPSAFIGQIAI